MLVILLPAISEARPFCIPLELGHDRWSPSKFGYTITQSGDSQHSSFTVVLSPDAAKAAERARLVVKKDGRVIVDADLAFKTRSDGGKEVIVTVDGDFLKDGEIIVFSDLYNAPLVPDFAGFIIALDKKWAEQAAAPNGP